MVLNYFWTFWKVCYSPNLYTTVIQSPPFKMKKKNTCGISLRMMASIRWKLIQISPLLCFVSMKIIQTYITTCGVTSSSAPGTKNSQSVSQGQTFWWKDLLSTEIDAKCPCVLTQNKHVHACNLELSWLF